MNNAIDKAAELGQAIVSSSEYKEYLKCKDVLETSLLSDKAAAYERALALLNTSLDKNSKLLQDAQKIVDDAKSEPIIIDYVNAKDTLAFLFDTINQTLAHITGMNDNNSSCGGCGGCKGCK